MFYKHLGIRVGKKNIQMEHIASDLKTQLHIKKPSAIDLAFQVINENYSSQ